MGIDPSFHITLPNGSRIKCLLNLTNQASKFLEQIKLVCMTKSASIVSDKQVATLVILTIPLPIEYSLVWTEPKTYKYICI